MFFYGAYYQGGRCNDDATKNEGHTEPSGSYPGCISPQGVYDLTGNLAEWVVTDEGEPVLLGGHMESGQASCAFSLTGDRL
jgi:formylglycine-generating enzyme required for sulfatase activity